MYHSDILFEVSNDLRRIGNDWRRSDDYKKRDDCHQWDEWADSIASVALDIQESVVYTDNTTVFIKKLIDRIKKVLT